MVDIGLIGTFHVIRAVRPHLTKPGTAVINEPAQLTPALPGMTIRQLRADY
jgi:hypothetical protein